LKSEVLLKEQVRLVERGVRSIALVVEPLDPPDEETDLNFLRKASEGLLVIPFAFDRHMAGYASHRWAIDLLIDVYASSSRTAV